MHDETQFPSSLRGLGHLHMFERPPCSKGPEVGQAVVEGYGTWRFGFVLVPAAEFGNDPSGPCERVLGMWIFLTCDLALDAGVERVDGVDLVLSKARLAGWWSRPSRA